MAITVDETKQSSEMGWTTEGGRTYDLQVRVVTDDPTIGARAAVRAVNVDIGSTYRFPLAAPTETDYGAVLAGVSTTRDEDGRGYLVTLRYGPFSPLDMAGNDTNGSLIVNPLLVPPGLKWTHETFEIACIYDRNGVKITNVIGDPFDPVLTRPYSLPVANITRTLASFDPNWITAFKDHINASDWMGFPAGTILCREITADRAYYSDWGWAWDQTLALAFKPIITSTDGTVIENGWAEVVLNAGLRQKVGGVVKQVMIDGSPASAPVPLTSKGQYDPTGDQGFLSFDVYPTADFDLFGLPPDLFSATTPSSPLGGS
ncbi:hypothetical protein [Paludisphaera borealis]|uniref:Uncharacterized protein n=1 Tax=Paludisphaera borealis TaxID=1387353 RepID=A0A1U7CNJ4_9BACT|nr:hypothetical protein [Paludisphaera borealis]APW60491.1 hypothetical protein BSF38_01961 [Paludisphaera borealis]